MSPPSVFWDPQEEGDDDLMFKMVFVVNMDLAMGVGKVGLYINTYVILGFLVFNIIEECCSLFKDQLVCLKLFLAQPKKNVNLC